MWGNLNHILLLSIPKHSTELDYPTLFDALLFCLSKTCNDSEMRVVLDQVNPDDIRQFYLSNFKELERLGITKEYEFWKKYLIVAIDGVHHVESKKIHCDGYLIKQHEVGSISYDEVFITDGREFHFST